MSVPSPELAVHRVAQRVSRGGHDIPEPVILRRFWRSLIHFERLYRPLSDAWTLYDSGDEELVPVASQKRTYPTKIHEPALWTEFKALQGRALARTFYGYLDR